MSTLQEKWQTNPVAGSLDILRAQLSQLRIVDIGVVELVLEGGTYAMVTLVDGTNTKLKCEVVSIGVGDTNIQAISANQYVIVIFPKTPVSISDDGTDISAQSYSSNYAKCIPIGLHKDTTVGLDIGTDEISITGKDYGAKFGPETVSILADNLRVSYDATSKRVSVAAGTNIVSIDTNNIELVTNASYDEQGSLSSFKNRIVMNKDAEVGMTISGDIKIDGALTVSGDIQTDGALTVTGNFSAADGNLTAEA